MNRDCYTNMKKISEKPIYRRGFIPLDRVAEIAKMPQWRVISLSRKVYYSRRLYYFVVPTGESLRIARQVDERKGVAE